MELITGGRPMLRFLHVIPALLLAIAGLPLSWAVIHAQESSPVASPSTLSANVAVLATGLDNPRGLKFGPDGLLYVAEGGTGGTISTAGQCEQVVAPVGPYTGGMTARISTISADGERTTLIDGLPSNQTSPQLGNQVSGVADIAFLDDTLYYLMAAAGCSHGHPDVPNGVFRVTDGQATLAADLSTFVKAHPVAHPNPGDFEPDEGAYAIAALDCQLYVSESNHGALDRVSADGTVKRIIDFSATEGHIVPTAIAVGPDGNFYIGNLTPLPYPNGGAVIYRLTPDGDLSLYARGLTTVLGAAFDAEGQLYVLETSTDNPEAPPFFHPDSGRVVRLTADDEWEVVATGLSFPTGMTFGPDGRLYVSNFGFGYPPGAGQIVTIDLSLPLPQAMPASAAIGGTPAVGTPAV
jgi:glucose/arabinose dehydrogenase